MTEILGQFRIGEDIVVALDAVEGDPLSVTGVTAAMRKMSFCGSCLSFDPDSPATPMTVSANVDGWTIRLAAADTLGLVEGNYGIDARLTVAGGVEITDQSAVVQLTRAALP